MRKWLITALIVTALAVSALYVQKWLPHFLSFVGTNSNVIQWSAAGTLLVVRLLRSTSPNPPQLQTAKHQTALAVDTPPQPSIPRSSALHQLPTPPDDFTGRVQELVELLSNVGQGGVHISGLRGMGVVGKTALALKLAEKVAPRYPDAQLYLDLKGADPHPVSTADAMLHVIRAYDPEARPLADEAELCARYRSVLHGQRALLLTDNAASREQVEPLIPPDTCLLIVTSRNHFNLPGIFDKDLDTLPPEDARKLLLKIAPRIGDQADQLAVLCGRLPLALRLAASALAERRDLSPDAYVRRLSDEQQRLKLIDASLALSYDLLTPELQTHWRALAVFPDTFDPPAAAAWELEPGVAEDTLGELLKYSLLEWDDKTARYSLHDLARLSADARQSVEERTTHRLRHAAHYLNVLREAKELYKQGGEGVGLGLGLFDLERRNIESGQALAEELAGSDNEAATLCLAYPDAGAHVLDLRLPPRERIRWLEAGLAAARRLKNRAAEGAHVGNLGLAYAALGEVRRAVELYEQQLTIARDIGDRRGEGTALWNMSLAFHELGERAKAIARAEASLRIREEIEDPRAGKVREKLAEWRGVMEGGGG